VFAYEPTWSQLAETTTWSRAIFLGLAAPSGEDALMSPRRWATSSFTRRTVWLERPHIVGPDVGTAAALFAAARNPVASPASS